MTRYHFSGGTLLCSLLLLAACDTAAPDLAEGPAGAFNPQPDPYMEIVRFSIDNPDLSGDPTRMRWVGRLGDGSVNVLTDAAEFRGAALHLVQTWTLIRGDGSRVVSLSGILNTQSGRLVLNGEGIHVQGWYSASGGVSSLGGEVMWTPKPDPPQQR